MHEGLAQPSRIRHDATLPAELWCSGPLTPTPWKPDNSDKIRCVAVRGIPSRFPRPPGASRHSGFILQLQLLHARLPVRVSWRPHGIAVARGGVIQRYMGKLSGPLLDRIDLHIQVPAVPYKELRGKDEGTATAEIRARVCEARAVQSGRGFYNAHIPASQLRKLCALDEARERTLEMAVRRMGLSARAHDRILKVASTVADLDHAHLAEAVQHRSLDRQYWS